MSSRPTSSLFNGQAEPARLSFKDGRWRLEVEVLERVSPVIFKPVVYIVEGPEQIVDVLERIGAPARLVEATIEILRDHAEPSAEALELERRDERWSAASVGQMSRLWSERRHRGAAETRSHASRKQALRRLHDKLAQSEAKRSRVEFLERRLVDLETQLREQRRAAARAPGPAEPGPAAQAPADAGPPRDDLEAKGDAPAAPPQAEPAPVDEAPQAAAPSGPRLAGLPSLAQIKQVLDMLFGEDSAVVEAPQSGSARLDYIAPIVDDGGEIVGAFLSDFVAMVRFGGKMIMLSDRTIDEMVASGDRGQEVVEALSEVANNLGGLLNDNHDNPHVRTLPVAALEEGQHAWLDAPTLRLDLQGGYGGRMIIVAR